MNRTFIHTSRIKLGIIDSLRVLFGQEVKCISVIETAEDVILDSRTTTVVLPILQERHYIPSRIQRNKAFLSRA